MKRAGNKSRPIPGINSEPSVPLSGQLEIIIDMAENKTNLTAFLSAKLIEKGQQLNNCEVVTAGGFTNELQAESTSRRNVKNLESNHEEADTRLILHAVDAKDRGYERTIIICKDTDVLFLLVHFFDSLSKEVWMQTGTSQSKKYTPVHEI